MRRRLLLLLLPLALLSACAAGAGASVPAKIPVYHVVSPERQRSGELISFENVAVPKGVAPLQAAVDALNAQPLERELTGAMPEGIRIAGVQLADGVASVRIDGDYPGLTGMEQTLINSCIAMTLCALEGVDAVAIRIPGAEAPAAELTAESLLLYDTEVLPYEKQLRLYFPDSSGEYLRPEYHTLTADANTPLERYVVEELLRGPYDDTLLHALPEDAALLSITTEDGLCTVDFSEKFLENMDSAPAEPRLGIYAVVNSLTALKEIDSVQFMVEGEPLLSYGHLSLIKPLTRNETVIGP